jgi:hypothetical protein
MEGIKYSPVNYYTYNTHSYFLSVSITVVYSIFFAILYLAFSYETSNRANICHPTFYYGGACRKQIANTVLKDNSFLNRKKDYYANLETTVKPMMENSSNKIDATDGTISKHLSENDAFNKKTVEEIEDITDVINLITTKYLGNIQHYLSSSSENKTGPVVQALQDIPNMIKSVQDKLNKALVEPTSAVFVSPLQKLYKALNNIAP